MEAELKEAAAVGREVTFRLPDLLNSGAAVDVRCTVEVVEDGTYRLHPVTAAR